jgi:uncharacterized circularly permuted ATP-grasp superfamily protein
MSIDWSQYEPVEFYDELISPSCNPRLAGRKIASYLKQLSLEERIPRTLSAKQWAATARGLKQRLSALNMFINDLYHERHIINEGVVPAHLIDRG